MYQVQMRQNCPLGGGPLRQGAWMDRTIETIADCHWCGVLMGVYKVLALNKTLVQKHNQQLPIALGVLMVYLWFWFGILKGNSTWAPGHSRHSRHIAGLSYIVQRATQWAMRYNPPQPATTLPHHRQHRQHQRQRQLQLQLPHPDKATAT
ncbi:hypothetical protein BD289DRAFT_184734 [Coniella lustricola]|uniref:Uncharacterized protein n=1 Tax=Coniella lustricola TaxID=2025994 RepID=A0A2T2ZT68_9PEZI|nr:hypothetical protein BD289DRAFT_184734 [Coniella lustricola]